MEPMVFWDAREVRGWVIISHKALIPMGEWCGWERYQKQLWNTTGVEKRKRYSHFRKQQEEWFRTWYGVFTTEKCKYFCDRRYFVIDKSLLMGEPAKIPSPKGKSNFSLPWLRRELSRTMGGIEGGCVFSFFQPRMFFEFLYRSERKAGDMIRQLFNVAGVVFLVRI